MPVCSTSSRRQRLRHMATDREGGLPSRNPSAAGELATRSATTPVVARPSVIQRYVTHGVARPFAGALDQGLARVVVRHTLSTPLARAIPSPFELGRRPSRRGATSSRRHCVWSYMCGSPARGGKRARRGATLTFRMDAARTPSRAARRSAHPSTRTGRGGVPTTAGARMLEVCFAARLPSPPLVGRS
jgi:hypothetical protein